MIVYLSKPHPRTMGSKWAAGSFMFSVTIRVHRDAPFYPLGVKTRRLSNATKGGNSNENLTRSEQHSGDHINSTQPIFIRLAAFPDGGGRVPLWYDATHPGGGFFAAHPRCTTETIADR